MDPMIKRGATRKYMSAPLEKKTFGRRQFFMLLRRTPKQRCGVLVDERMERLKGNWPAADGNLDGGRREPVRLRASNFAGVIRVTWLASSK
jgi:hypothetical protein